VTLIQRAPQILVREDRDAAGILHDRFTAEGIDLQLGVKILAARQRNGEKFLSLEREGKTYEVAVDAILVGVGRTPNTEGLGLETAGVAHDSKGVSVNDSLQTSNPHIYAAGDICSPHKFTHTADAQARILIANALFMGRQKTSALTIPWCTYCDPEIAHVGLYERDAASQGIEVTTLTVALDQVDRAVLDGETNGWRERWVCPGTPEKG